MVSWPLFSSSLDLPSYLHEHVTLRLDAVHEQSDDGVEFGREGGEGDEGAHHATVNASLLHPLVLLL